MSCTTKFLYIRILQNVLSFSYRLLSTPQNRRLNNSSTYIHFFSTRLPNLWIFTNRNILKHFLKLRILQKRFKFQKFETTQVGNYFTIYNKISAGCSRSISCLTVKHFTNIIFYHISKIIKLFIYRCNNSNKLAFSRKIYRIRTRFIGVFYTTKIIWFFLKEGCIISKESFKLRSTLLQFCE